MEPPEPSQRLIRIPVKLGPEGRSFTGLTLQGSIWSVPLFDPRADTRRLHGWPGRFCTGREPDRLITGGFVAVQGVRRYSGSIRSRSLQEPAGRHRFGLGLRWRTARQCCRCLPRRCLRRPLCRESRRPFR